MKPGMIVAGSLLVVAAGCSAMHARAVDPMERARSIEAKIAEAEELGARSCSPRELAKLKVALEHVVHEWEEGYYPAAWLEPDFVETEKRAEEMLRQRQFAAALGTRFRCVSRPPAPTGRGREPGMPGSMAPKRTGPEVRGPDFDVRTAGHWIPYMFVGKEVAE